MSLQYKKSGKITRYMNQIITRNQLFIFQFHLQMLLGISIFDMPWLSLSKILWSVIIVCGEIQLSGYHEQIMLGLQPKLKLRNVSKKIKPAEKKLDEKNFSKNAGNGFKNMVEIYRNKYEELAHPSIGIWKDLLLMKKVIF